MKIFSQDLFWSLLKEGTQLVTLTVIPMLNGAEASDATVTLEADGYNTVTGTGRQSITVPAGTDVEYTIEKANYNTVGPLKITPYKSYSVTVPLSNRPTRTVTIYPTPADAAITIENLDVPGEITTSSSATVGQGYTVRVTLSHAGLQNYTSEFVVGAEDMDKYLEMTANISIGDIIPSDATKELSVGDYSFANPNYSGTVTVPCSTQAVYWRVSKPGYVTEEGVVSPVSPATYLVDTVKPDGSDVSPYQLSLRPLTFTVTCADPTTAMVSLNVTRGNNVINETQQHSASMTCYIGETISYRVYKNNYYDFTGSQLMSTVDITIDNIVLEPATRRVVVTAMPNTTVITATNNGQTYTGVGSLGFDGVLGSSVIYSGTYGGVSTGDQVATVVEGEGPQYLDPISLSALDQNVTIMTSSETRVLQPGRYFYLLVGGGNSGQPAGTQTQTGTDRKTFYGAWGGFGGGSGYVHFGSFTLNAAHEAVFTVGQGGDNTGTTMNAGGVSSISIPTANIEESTTAMSTNLANGGSGGGARGGRQLKQYTIYSGITAIGGVGTSGGKGAYGGGNAEGAVTYRINGEALSYDGGTGYYNTNKYYENNNGSPGTSSSNHATGGGGGRGLVSIQSQITPQFLAQLNDEQVLYNAMGGGGGGGGTNAPDSLETVGAIKGGSGGGGGGWYNGASATNPDSSTASVKGAGGGGAILIARYDWGQ